MRPPWTPSHLPGRLGRLAIPERPVAGMSLREAERQLEHSEAPAAILDLTYADTHRFPPPTWAAEDFVEAARGGGMTYTPYRGDPQVREIVAANLRASLGFSVDPHRHLILTPGTQAALFAALAAMVDEGDQVLLVDPDYLTSERILRFFGAEVVHVPLVQDGDRATLDFDVVGRALGARTKGLVFSHPNNPTGAVYDRDTVERIAEVAVRNDLWILADELYCRLVYDGASFYHLAQFHGLDNRCVTLLGPSKTESLSGYRLGLGIGPKAIIDGMEDVQSVTALRAPAYAQHVLKCWLADDAAFVAARVADYQRLRDATLERIAAVDFIDVKSPKGTAYMFPKLLTDRLCDQTVATALKQEAGLIINPGYQFGPSGRGHFRICFAQEETVWGAALDRMIEVLGKYVGHAPTMAAGRRGYR